MTITNENILQADYEVIESWRGRDGASDQGNHPKTMTIVPEQFQEDVRALCRYAGLHELTPGMTVKMTLREALNVIPKKRKRLDSYKTLIGFLANEMGVTLIIYSKKTKTT